MNDEALQRVHPGQQTEYRYKFSEVPFAGQPVADALFEVLRNNPRIDQATKDNYNRSLSDEDSVTTVDIFGSYPNYSPLAFDSVLKPAAQQWAQIAGPGRGTFWRYRRARPLAASLPMTDDERRAMTAGWFLGQVVGRIQIPQSPYTEAVRIYDADAGHWLNFPNPLLTPPSAFIATYDWLPAVLESILLAIAQSHEPPVMRSLRPYGVLRELYDSHSQDPASGIVELSATEVLREFLRTGATAPGVTPRIEAIAAATTPEERATAAEEWLTTIRNVAAQYLPAEMPGAARGGTFTSIPTRSTASKHADLPRPGSRRVLGDGIADPIAAARDAWAATAAGRRWARGDPGGRNVLTMSMPTTSQRALTVLVVPGAQTEEIVAVLADYSARRAARRVRLGGRRRRRGASTPATVVRDGRSEPVVLQQLLTAERYDRIRVAVLVPD